MKVMNRNNISASNGGSSNSGRGSSPKRNNHKGRGKILKRRDEGRFGSGFDDDLSSSAFSAMSAEIVFSKSCRRISDALDDTVFTTSDHSFDPLFDNSKHDDDHDAIDDNFMPPKKFRTSFNSVVSEIKDLDTDGFPAEELKRKRKNHHHHRSNRGETSSSNNHSSSRGSGSKGESTHHRREDRSKGSDHKREEKDRGNSSGSGSHHKREEKDRGSHHKREEKDRGSDLHNTSSRREKKDEGKTERGGYHREDNTSEAKRHTSSDKRGDKGNHDSEHERIGRKSNNHKGSKTSSSSSKASADNNDIDASRSNGQHRHTGRRHNSAPTSKDKDSKSGSSNTESIDASRSNRHRERHNTKEKESSSSSLRNSSSSNPEDIDVSQSSSSRHNRGEEKPATAKQKQTKQPPKMRRREELGSLAAAQLANPAHARSVRLDVMTMYSPRLSKRQLMLDTACGYSSDIASSMNRLSSRSLIKQGSKLYLGGTDDDDDVRSLCSLGNDDNDDSDNGSCHNGLGVGRGGRPRLMKNNNPSIRASIRQLNPKGRSNSAAKKNSSRKKKATSSLSSSLNSNDNKNRGVTLNTPLGKLNNENVTAATSSASSPTPRRGGLTKAGGMLKISLSSDSEDKGNDSDDTNFTSATSASTATIGIRRGAKSIRYTKKANESKREIDNAYRIRHHIPRRGRRKNRNRNNNGDDDDDCSVASSVCGGEDQSTTTPGGPGTGRPNLAFSLKALEKRSMRCVISNSNNANMPPAFQPLPEEDIEVVDELNLEVPHSRKSIFVKAGGRKYSNDDLASIITGIEQRWESRDGEDKLKKRLEAHTEGIDDEEEKDNKQRPVGPFRTFSDESILKVMVKTQSKANLFWQD